MNVPFPPLLLWPVPIGMVAGGIYWARVRRLRWKEHLREWRTLAKGTDAENKPPKLSPQPLWGLMILLGLVWGYWLARYSLPPVHGVLLDARTGSPVAGATVIRYCFRTGPFDLVDTHGPAGVPGSFVKATTDSRGRFVLPGLVVRSLTGMGWITFKPGLMLGNGCYTARWMQPLGCAGFGASWHPDPWVKVNFRGNIFRLKMEVCLFPPTTDGAPREGYDSAGKFLAATPPDLNSDGRPFVVDAWGEYFRRLNALTYQHFLDLDISVKEAVTYATNNQLTEGSVFPFLEFAEKLSPYRVEGRERERSALLGAVARYCAAAPESKTCGLPTVKYDVEEFKRGTLK